MTFAHNCTPGQRMTMAFVGDLLFHKKLQYQAYAKGSNFRRFFTPLKDFLTKADYLYGNLEGPAADGVAGAGRKVRDPGKRYDGRVYSAHLKTLNFNYHPSVIDDLQAVGFDILSTANNHTLDRGPLGVDRTIENLDKRGMAYFGTRKRVKAIKIKNKKSASKKGEAYKSSKSTHQWARVTSVKGHKFAWMACSFSANGLRDRGQQMLNCYQDKSILLEQMSELSKRGDIAGVILTPHWGVEGQPRPLKRQKLLAREAINAGALLVIGTHPHIIQPWEKVTRPDKTEGLIVYSTGNFISNQRRLMQRAGIIALTELVIDKMGKAHLSEAGFVPSWVVIDHKGHRVRENRGLRGWPKTARLQTLKWLPKGNVLRARWPLYFKKNCVTPASKQTASQINQAQ